MSGIIGVVQFDGQPLDRGLLQQLTNFLAFRGPDAQRIWTNHNVGFGHTLFKTTDESERDCQPLTLDGKAWIVADGRIDAREDLFTALKAAGEADLERSDCADAELILRAYRCWGPNCVERLLGDFAFGIWDNSRQQLFCARDHMGVKPFYYAQVGSSVIFSNTLDCIRRHPLVSDGLNDSAIADFLLFGFNQNSATTAFAGIQRMPPGHCALWSRSGLQLNRYWSIPIDEPLFYRRSRDYIDQFDELLRKCVADRLRRNQVWVFMSGGLDSAALAATAQELMGRQYAQFDIRALTKIDSFLPEEARYAQTTADYLRLPIIYHNWTDGTDPSWEQVSFSTPEPAEHAWVSPAENKFWRGLACSRVFLYGEGPDNALHCDWAPYLSRLLSQRKYGLFARSVFSALISERRPPFCGRLSRTFSRLFFHKAAQTAYPECLNRELESRLRLRETWNETPSAQTIVHPWRPRAYASLLSPLWQTTFEALDAGATKAPYEMRYPFVDIRMLRFLLSLPALPWCRSKRLLRIAMTGRLPKPILHRKKTGIDQHLVFKYIERLCRLPLKPAIDLHVYVNTDRLPQAGSPNASEINLRVRSLNHWLQHSRPSQHNAPRQNEEILCDRSV
jgi:asparagine synthase (glutamine-hydrolysing)